MPTDALRQHLDFAFDRLSNGIAGGQRIHPNDLLPGAQDPFEGIIPDDFRPETTVYDWFDPTVWAGATPDQIPGFDLSAMSPSTGGRDGTGLDFFRGGEAPDNFTNRNNPLYVARKNFAIAVHSQIEEAFGVSAGGSAGYLRPPSSSDAAPGGRSPNSDHYSGGALDFTGSDEQLTRLRNWLVDQPWVSFVRWQSESHFDHLHASIDLGWVAQNWYGKNTLPSAPPRQPTGSVETPVSQGPLPQPIEGQKGPF